MGVLDTLPLEVKITLEVPQDLIPLEGITEVNDYLHKQLYHEYSSLHNYADYNRYLNRDFDRSWTVLKGTYSGTFPKRVASFMYRERNIRLTAEQQSEVGNIAKRHCTKNSVFIFDITDKFNWKAGDFGDDNSCYWGDRKNARRLLVHYNARAIRFYRPENPRLGIARAWLAPLIPEALVFDKNNAATKMSNELKEQGFVAFNGYGHETQRAARILATHLGLSYSAIGLANYGGTNGVLWINHYSGNQEGSKSGSAFLIGPVEVTELVKSVDLRFNVDVVDMADCNGTCGRRYRSGDLIQADDQYFCRTCYDAVFFTCAHCHDGGRKDRAATVVVGTLKGIRNEFWCQRCTRSNAFVCTGCSESFSTGIKITPEDNDTPWCQPCFVSRHQKCKQCESRGEVFWRENGKVEAGTVCVHCKEAAHES